MKLSQASLLASTGPALRAIDNLRAKSRDSGYFPGDPPELKRAWTVYVDAYARDAAKPRRPKQRHVAVSNDTVLAWDAYWQVVDSLALRQLPPFEKLDIYSAKPRLTDMADREEWA